MKIGYELTIEQTQKLSMTPELIQAIRILQYNNQELGEYVEKELLENPVLESENTGDDGPLDIREKIVEDNYGERTFSPWKEVADDGDYTYEQYATEDITLETHLLQQLQLSKISDRRKRIARFIIEALDDNGYLTLSLEEIAAVTKESVEEVEKALNYVQTFDPSGVCARNLAECLTIQLAAKGLLTDEIDFIISNMLGDLADNKLSTIAKSVGIKTKDVQAIADLIKTLEPKPGREFSSGESTRYVVPDIFVEKINGEYIVTNNDSSVPRLMVSSYYTKLQKEAKQDEELNKYLNDRFNAAVWLIRSIEQRKQTIYNVASAIVQYQQDFFDKGEKYLKPLTLHQIADDVNVHESTVSRSINGKYMQSPRGVFEMKYFFSSGVAAQDGEGLSSNSVKSFIKEIIEEEDPKKPFSDQDIAIKLGEKGITISRRTVAKYREGMHILSSSKRKRF